MEARPHEVQTRECEIIVACRLEPVWRIQYDVKEKKARGDCALVLEGQHWEGWSSHSIASRLCATWLRKTILSVMVLSLPIIFTAAPHCVERMISLHDSTASVLKLIKRDG